MDFKFNPQKAVQAAALFLKRHGKPMAYMKLLKLLYIADRNALNVMDQTITGDKYVSMDYGPVLSIVYNLISHGPAYDENSPWLSYISAPKNYAVELKNDPGRDDLCEEEEEIINSVYDQFGKIDKWTLSDLTHFFPEWTNPKGSAIPIKIDAILREMGRSEEDIKEINQNIEKENYLDFFTAHQPGDSRC